MTKTDYPAHCKQVVFGRYDEPPEQNGDFVTWNRWDSPGVEPVNPVWSIVEYACGSDYNGCLANEANRNTLRRMLEELHPREAAPVVWCELTGGYGTYGLAVRYDLISEEVREAIDALEDYPLADENEHSDLEREAESAAWESWAEDDFQRELCKHYGECDWPEAIDTYELFRIGCEVSNENWENEQGSDMWIRVDRVAAAVQRILEGEAYRDWFSADMLVTLCRARELLTAAAAEEQAS